MPTLLRIVVKTMLKLGSLKLESNLILAPMSGVSDLPFRLLNRRFGCELAFVEMINVRALGYKSMKTEHLLTTTSHDKPLGVQLLAGEEKWLKRGLDILKKYHYDILDFNAACPARKVTRRGEGASLLKDSKKLQKLLSIIVKTAKVPVTVKIRAGWDKVTINAVEVGKACQDAGIDALFIHGRTKTQEYSGQVDYTVIHSVKKALRIPVIASGDIFSAQLAKKMIDETGCDAVLVARGAFGNPWIFQEIPYYFKHGKAPARPDADAIVDTMLEHYKGCIDFYTSAVSVSIFRKFFGWYTKGFRGVRPLREESNRARTAEKMIQIIEKCRNLTVSPVRQSHIHDSACAQE